MKHVCVVLLICLAIVALFGAPARASVVGFDSVPVGTQYGADYGDSAGDVVLVEDNISISVEEFVFGSFHGLIKAEVGGLYAQFFPSPALDLDNITVQFDLGDLGFDATRVTVEYKEFGGTDNFIVNGHTLYQLAAMTDLPADVAPGVVAQVADGVITLDGVVSSFAIGGQEMAIDTIVAVPEPTSLALLGMCGAALLRRRDKRKDSCN